jgi:hypothetical protein
MRLQVAIAGFSCSLPDYNLDPYFIFMYMHYNHCHRTTAHLQLIIIIIINSYMNIWDTMARNPSRNIAETCQLVDTV